MSFKKYTSLGHPFEYDTIYEYNTHYDYEKYDEEEYYIDEECYDDSINFYPNEFQVDKNYIWVEERSNDLDMHVALFQRLEFIEKCNKANGVYNEEFEQEHSMILDALETIRQRMRNPYIQGRSPINQATKSTEVVEGSPLELEEFSSTVEITHANEVSLPELIPQQKTELEDSPLELKEFSSTVEITREVTLPELISQ